MNFDAFELFTSVHPGFFEKDSIRSISPELEYEEQLLDLKAFSPTALSISCPEHITFGMYTGELALLHEAILSVDEGWLSCYPSTEKVYCAFDGDRIVSFCLLDDFGSYKGLRIGGPGCVGTIPEYRRQGIGLKMVQNATTILKERGYDLSYIHYTGVGHWYARLGYETLLRWNSKGIVL